MIGAKEVSARELLDAHLARIDAVNPAVNAIVALDPDVGRRPGPRRRRRHRRAARTVGPLAGLVTAHKDLEETADFPTTYGSPLFAGHRPAADCLLVARMKAAGAVAVGKTNTPEFGAGSHTFNRVYGVDPQPVGPRAHRPAGRAAARPSPSRAGWWRPPTAATPAARCATRRRGTTSSGSVRRCASCPTVGPGNAWMPISTRGPDGPHRRRRRPAARRARPRPTTATRCTARSTCPPRSPPPERPLRVAWSPDLGVPVERDAARRARRHPPGDGRPRLGRRRRRAGRSPCASDCFRVLRAWNIANGPTAALPRPAWTRSRRRSRTRSAAARR